MSRIPRPNIPIEARCRAAMRQLGEMFPDDVIGDNHRRLGRLLASLLEQLTEILRADKLHLDHDPALENRPYNPRIKKVAARFTPDANDPLHLIYRVIRDEGPATLEPGPLSHHVKTHVRGEGARRSDTAERVHRRRVDKNRDRREATAAGKPKKRVQRTGRTKWAKGRKIENRNNLRKRP